jgi:beta-lactamase regulating signal transducer with metallopeptidase domain
VPALLAVWLGGSVAWFALAGCRLVRFHRLLRHGRPAPAALQERARALAAKLGPSRAPTVWLVPGTISPLLWALFGPGRLVVSEGLLARLDARQQEALLAHELAHLRRGDPRVRCLEFLVLGLYWWHPVAWWARRELREAEEQCCDAWVVWALPGTARAYATALVETVDFLAEARPALPPLASGLGHFSQLRRRLIMIMRGTRPQTLTRAGLAAVLALGVALLPLMPALVRSEEPPGDRRDPPKKGTRDTNRSGRNGDGDKETRDPKQPTRNGGGDKDTDLAKARADVKARLAELQKMKADLDARAAVLRKMQAELEAQSKKLRAAEVQLKKAAERLSQLEKRRDPGRGGDDRRNPGRRPDPKVKERLQPRGRPDGDRRIEELERKLDRLIRELEALRKEIRGGNAGDRRPGTRPRGTRDEKLPDRQPNRRGRLPGLPGQPSREPAPRRS